MEVNCLFRFSKKYFAFAIDVEGLISRILSKTTNNVVQHSLLGG